MEVCFKATFLAARAMLANDDVFDAYLEARRKEAEILRHQNRKFHFSKGARR
jgi:hypothetical protein